MSIKNQAALRGFPITGSLTRYPDIEPSRYHFCFLDEADNLYILHLGVLTIIASDGQIY